MKSAPALANDAYIAFIRAHPELSIGAADPFTAHVINEEKIYSKIAIDHAVLFVIEQIQLEQGTKKKRI